MADALVGIGANMLAPRAMIDEARLRLEGHADIDLSRFSSVLRTKAVGASPQSDYCNAAAVVQTSLAPDDLLDQLLAIETAMGRVRKEHWGARVIDLDLLLYEKEIFFSDRLQVPHPWLTVRHFALVPAVEIVPQWIHPLTGETLASLLRCHHRPCISVLGATSDLLAAAAKAQRDSVSADDRMDWLTDPTPNAAANDNNAARRAVVRRWVQSNPSTTNRRCVAPFSVDAEHLAAVLIADDAANVYRVNANTAEARAPVGYSELKSPFAICPSRDPFALSEAIRFIGDSLANRDE